MPIDVRVVSPEREVFAGEADLVVAKGKDGDVGILAGHAPMLISLAVHPVRIKSGADERVVLVEGGFLHVTPGERTRVDVLAEHAALPEEVDVAEARARLEELQARPGEAPDAEVRKAEMRVRYGAG